VPRTRSVKSSPSSWRARPEGRRRSRPKALAAALATARTAKCPVVVAKLDRLLRAVAFVSRQKIGVRNKDSEVAEPDVAEFPSFT
jgi:hypothetical protein